MAAFATDGFAVVRGLIGGDEAEAHRQVIEPLAIETAYERGAPRGDGSLEGAFLQSFNLWRLDDHVASFVLDPRFAAVAARLLGVERVRLYHDQALCKGPDGGRTPWHQDHWYWPLDTDDMITMWMPLVDLGDDVGSMSFARGSHVHGDLAGGGISKETDTRLRAVIDERGFETHTYGPMQAGDATFHHGWTVHAAGCNRSSQLRTVMTVIYFADGARVADELNPAQDVDRQAWVGGRERGELADHELNPLLG
ncbi:MAG: phytanoyl-CoA dioxygenase family protein [Actinomycetota bacterium]|nr:phytanoyl-CoA dioxygenase family protein [Actinomycetota bacterium]